MVTMEMDWVRGPSRNTVYHTDRKKKLTAKYNNLTYQHAYLFNFELTLSWKGWQRVKYFVYLYIFKFQHVLPSLRRTICVTFLLANLITWVHLQNSPHWSMSVLLQTTFLALTIPGETYKKYYMASTVFFIFNTSTIWWLFIKKLCTEHCFLSKVKYAKWWNGLLEIKWTSNIKRLFRNNMKIWFIICIQ